MKHIRLFETFGNKTEEEIHLLCKEYDIEDYTINTDFTIDVRGGVNLNNKKLTKLPLSFNNVYGNFYCDRNTLTTLEGSPNIVEGSFYCEFNLLTSLEYGPVEVSDNYYCYNNNISTFKYTPLIVGERFKYNNNLLPEVINNIMHNQFKVKTLLKHQDEYGIWNNDGSLNRGRWDIFQEDYKKMILNK